jgi:hypothetical protein
VASLPSGNREFAASTRACVDRMRRAGYFLQDHAGLVAAIGDTDSMTVDELSPGFRVLEGERSLFDPESGYGIFKGAVGKSDCRYVVFRIPGSGDTLLRRHLHMDALSVFFAHGGETILGDTGRYSYASSPVRAHCLSPSAHNTLLPSPDLYSANTTRLVDQAADRSSRATTIWSASMTLAGSICRRTVTIPSEHGAFTVVDSILPAQAGAHDPGDLIMLWNTGIDVVAVERLHDDRASHEAWRLTTRAGKSVAVTVSSSGPKGAGILDVREASGEREPRLAWYSPAQGVLRPVTTLVIRIRRAPSVVITTRVEVTGADCGAAAERRVR